MTLYVGLPASGKSSQAKERIIEGKGKTKGVERDALRNMLDAGRFSPKNEQLVTEIQEMIIKHLLDRGKDVIVSDTNLHTGTRQRLAAIAKGKGAEVAEDHSFLNVSVEECIKRDLARANSVGEHVIRRMYHKYIQPFFTRPVNAQLPPTIICDLDGTVADLNGRNPYDASLCAFDLPRAHVIGAVQNLQMAYNARLVFLSGRHDTYRQQTEEWLSKRGFVYEALFMRAAGDNRPDVAVKREMFNTHIADQGRVVAVFDDRPSIIRQWRELGLPVFDVGYGIDF